MNQQQFQPTQCKCGKIKTQQAKTITPSSEVGVVWKLPTPKIARLIANGQLNIPQGTCPSC